MRIFSKCTCWLMICVLLWGSVHFAFADQYLDVEASFAHKESFSGLVSIPGVEMPVRYYAQNDALWSDLVYERKDSKKRRPFRDSGCGPTALAMAILSLVDENEISRIGAYAKKPYSLCTCSLNDEQCDRHAARYYITSERDFVRFLPLVLGDFAAGNNTFGVYSRSETVAGTSTGYIEKVCTIYGLDCRFTYDYNEALEALSNKDASVFALAGNGGCFTNVGHYVYLAHADEAQLYVLDPLCRKEYKTSKSSKLCIIEPGLVSLDHADVSAANFSNFIILTKHAGQ